MSRASFLAILSLFGLFFCLAGGNGTAQEKGGGPALADARLGKPQDYNGYFPFTPPTDLKEWTVRRQLVREQILVGNGLWPMPVKTPLEPVIHGKIQRDGYTIEKVYFASYPGHYISGNLYRPTGKNGKLPAVLSPHGHWPNGRLYETPDKEIAVQMKQGAEKTLEGAKYPLQARCAHLARMGCIVFFYDMVGMGDSQPIPHAYQKELAKGGKGFVDAQAELRLQNFMGLQTWNSIRALDFLLSLPDVDAERIGVTGASGGGTQTMMLCAIDERPAAAFPAVMVSTAMQGGCVCENCSYLRIGTGNIEFAGLFAPKPLGMSAANDWTKELETKGLPQLKALYKLYGAEDKVMGKAHLEFGHNYNQVSREIMYNFFNKHLKLGQAEPVVERPFVPVPPKELSVYDTQHPLPKDAADATTLRRYLSEASDKQLAALMPKDAKGLEEMRKILKPALRVMMDGGLPAYKQLQSAEPTLEDKGGLTVLRGSIGRKDSGEVVPITLVSPRNQDGVVIWVHPDGIASLWQDGKLVPAAQKIIDKKAAILAVEVFRTGAASNVKATPVFKGFGGYTFGYNRPLPAERVHDILTAIAFARGHTPAKKLHLVGFGKAGPWVVLARSVCDDEVVRTAADMNQFNFADVASVDDEMLLPGAVKYGGLPTLASLCAPHELMIHNCQGTGSEAWLSAAYTAAGHGQALRRVQGKSSAEETVGWLLRD